MMESEYIWNHYGMWGGVLFFTLLYSIFLLFMPFYKKSRRKPTSATLAFIVAFAVEMHGIPFSMYLISWLFGYTLPEGVLWGHTLQQYIGYWGMYINIFLSVSGCILIVFGWKEIYKQYWSKEKGNGELVSTGIYRYIRHPQYTGLFLITIGMICEWATIPLLFMWPFLLFIYYRLAKREERDMEIEFGSAYRIYMAQTSMFLPLRRYREPMVRATVRRQIDVT